MEQLFDILNDLPLFLVILMRVSGLMVAAPVYNSRNIPGPVKVFFTLLLSVIIFFLVSGTFSVPELSLQIIIVFVSEFLVGIVIGYAANLLFSAIQLAGQSIDMQMGFGIVNVMDPQTGIQVPLMGTFKYLIAILVFFAINGHYWLIQALFFSYELVPINGLQINEAFTFLLIDLTGKMFLIAFKLAAPMVGALFITDFVMGIISRTVPQMNVFLVGMPAKILFGFLLLIIIIPLYVYLLTALFERNLKDMISILKVLT